MSITLGEFATDVLTGDELFVVERTGTPVSEQVATYDYNKNPITVYEMEQDKEYECELEDEAITVVYPDALEKRFGETDVTVEEVQEKIEAKKIKPYYFPSSRLE